MKTSSYNKISNIIAINLSVLLFFFSYKTKVFEHYNMNLAYSIIISVAYMCLVLVFKKDIIFFKDINSWVSKIILKYICIIICNDSYFKFQVINNKLCLHNKQVEIVLKNIKYRIKIYDDGLDMFNHNYIYMSRFSFLYIRKIIVPLINQFKIQINPAKCILSKM